MSGKVQRSHRYVVCRSLLAIFFVSAHGCTDSSSSDHAEPTPAPVATVQKTAGAGPVASPVPAEPAASPTPVVPVASPTPTPSPAPEASPTPVVTVTPAPTVVLPAAPSALALVSSTNNALGLSWSDNATNELIYEVESCITADCTDFLPVARSPLQPNTAAFTQTGLTADTFYSFRVRAVGYTGASDYVTLHNLTTLASPNSTFAVVGKTSSSISISWVASAPPSSLFEVQRCKGTACTNFASVFDSPLPPSTSSYIEYGLRSDSIYRFRVRAKTATSVSDWLTSSDIPTLTSAPTGITAAVVSGTAVNLAWTDNSSNESGYQVQSCAGLSCSTFADVVGSPTAANVSSLAITGLTPGTKYSFRVRANAAGADSDWTNLPAQVTTLPAAPTSFALITSSETSMILAWIDSASDELFYELQRCDGLTCSAFTPVLGSPLPANSSGFSASGLTASSFHSFRVRAVSAAGLGAWATLSDLQNAPAAPTSLIVSGSPSSSAISVVWTDNASDETGFEVERCSGTGCSSYASVGGPIAANIVTLADTGLSGGTVYKYRVRAVRSGTPSTWAESAEISTLAPSASCASPKSVVIDAGQKGSVASVQRGLFSSTATIPGSGSPASAYYDGSATGGTGTIKYTYWNGTQWIVEHVASTPAGALGVNSMKLVFLKTGANAGRPIVFWTTGSTNVLAAIRSAASSVSGTWSVTTMDNIAGNANRAIEAAVSPTDQVAVAYLTNTLATGRARFIYCDAGCSSLAGMTMMTGTTDTIENSNILAATNQIGVGFCADTTSNLYYPTAVYPGLVGAQIRYASCRTGVTAGSLTGCKTAGGWGTPLSIVATSAGHVASRIYMDPTIVGDTPKILTRNTGATLGQLFEVAQGCNVAPTSANAGATFGGAATLNSWGSLMKDSTGRFHIIANNGTTDVQYFNSTSNTFTGTLNAVGTVETITLPAAAAGIGSAEIAGTQIYSSYGGNAAPFDFTMGVVNDVTQPSNSANQLFYSLIPDVYGNVLLNTATGQQRNVSMATTSTGKPGVAYIDFSVGAAAGARLKYSFRNGTTATIPWNVNFIPGTSSPAMPSLAYDNLDRPWISYYDGSNFRYYLIVNSQADGSGSWTKYQFPIGAKVATATAPASDDTALAMSYAGGVASPVVVVLNSTAAGGTGVRAAKLNPTTGVWSVVQTLDSLGASFASRLAADFDKSGNIVLSYYDLTTNQVKFNATASGTTWQASSTVIATSLGREGISVKLNPLTSKPSVSYYNRTSDTVVINVCSSALASCSNSINWTAANVATAVGLTGLAVAQEQILNTSISFNSAGTPFVSYAIGGNNQSLQLADKSSGSFVTAALQSSVNSNLTGMALFNSGMTGLNVSSVRNTLGQFLSSYVGPNNWLYATTCGD